MSSVKTVSSHLSVSSQLSVFFPDRLYCPQLYNFQAMLSQAKLNFDLTNFFYLVAVNADYKINLLGTLQKQIALFF